jgi:uncharacterized protein (TIGR02145 family)
MMKRTTCILLLALLMFSCKQKDIWNNVKVENTILSYENYLKKYPEGKFSDSANFCIEELIWDKTSKENNISAYEEYLKQYPEGRYLDSAKLLRAAISVVKDIDGNVYKTVTIGNQVWMVENLRTTKFRNGDFIGTTTPATLDILGESSPKYQWAYDGKESNVATYGRLYTWYAVTDSRNVCPADWHVPSDAEWETLTYYLTYNGYGYGGSGADIAKSMAATLGWTLYPTVGKVGNDQASNNSSGFTALPSGFRDGSGAFDGIGFSGVWWSSTEYSTSIADRRSMNYSLSYVSVIDSHKQYGLSVRCLKD